tara:strand:- start:1684 stop:1929 length:246 start_codon:yes stop_codon:yes gene_type:complete
MEEDSGFKMLVKNESDKDRIIRAIIAVVLIAFYFAVPSSINATIANIGLVVAGVLLFNAVSGTCMIYRAFGINTCPVKSTE